ncbi:uncharacterized protein [Procambarus clarkii]|uniref:uncharacterized protein n=1 Tax=Procambarus clarkii TaxID=6728 RepID=UPI003742FDCA
MSSDTSGVNASEPFNEVCLPAIDLPHFQGRDDENFECYWNTSDSLLNSKNSINKTKKFLYLRSTLKGESKAVIDHLNQSNDDFDTAIQLLEVNYSNKEIVIANLYYKRRATPTLEPTPEALQDFRLRVESVVQALAAKVTSFILAPVAAAAAAARRAHIREGLLTIGLTRALTLEQKHNCTAVAFNVDTTRLSTVTTLDGQHITDIGKVNNIITEDLFHPTPRSSDSAAPPSLNLNPSSLRALN